MILTGLEDFAKDWMRRYCKRASGLPALRCKSYRRDTKIISGIANAGGSVYANMAVRVKYLFRTSLNRKKIEIDLSWFKKGCK